MWSAFLMAAPLVTFSAPSVHWKLDETNSLTAFESRQGYHGALINFPDATNPWGAGMVGGALRFDGTNDHVSHGYTFPAQRGTISHWLRPESTNAGTRVAVYQSDSTDSPSRNGFGNAGAIVEIHTGISAGKWSFFYQHGTSAAGDQENVAGYGRFHVVGSAASPAWTHVAVTWDRASDIVLYVNGVEAGRTALSVGVFNSTPIVVRELGEVGDGTVSRHWQGGMDDVQVYDVPLSAEEIRLLYRYPGATIPFLLESDAVIHWKLDETNSPIANEFVTGTTGILVNVSTSQWRAGRVGGALFFDGVNDRITNGVPLPRPRGTFSHWLYVEDHTEAVRTAYYEGNGGVFPWNGMGAPNDLLEIHSGIVTGQWCFIYQDGPGAGGASYNDPGYGRFELFGGAVTTQTWTHVAATWDRAGDFVLYVNGAEVDRTALSVGAFSNHTAGTFYIGRVGDGELDRYWKGMVDDIQVYDTALTPADIKLLYDYPGVTMPFLRMEAGRSPAGLPSLIWQCVTTGLAYTVEASSNLGSATWLPVPPTNQWPVTAGAWTNSAPASGPAFYRVRAAP